MANNYYQLYIDSVFNLAYTISVKFEQAAQAINNKVMMEQGFDTVDLEDPYTWRYYQNISGAYHFTNSNIEVTSLDTLQTIPFTKSVLLNHPATLKAYSYNTIYYNNLIDKYPDDELLIKGILYPCDIATAIQAKDGTILSYPSHLVDSNEYSFITKLQDWIYDYLHRWINKQYAIAHDLYVPMYMSQFYMHLIPAIVNIRLGACKTNEAHSFHIRQRLASNQYLDKYWNHLTREQALFFYRNIDYIQVSAGRQEVFDWLVENVMTKRGLPIYGFDARHDTSVLTDVSVATIDRPLGNIYEYQTLSSDKQDTLSELGYSLPNEYLSGKYITKQKTVIDYLGILYVIKVDSIPYAVTGDWLIDSAHFDVFDYKSIALANRSEVIFRRLPINYPAVDPKRNIYSVFDMLDKINVLATDNSDYHYNNKTDINNRLVDAKTSNILSKLLESAITDYSQAVPYPLADSLLNEWISMANSNRYNVFVSFEFPINKETTTHSAKDAFTLFTYCMLKYRGIDTLAVNKIIASRVYKQTLPTLQWMKDYFKNSNLSNQMLSNVFTNAPPTTGVNSIDAFYSRVFSIYQLNLQHYYTESRSEHYITTGELKVANTQLFEDKVIYPLPDNTTYQQWLNSFSYDFSEYTQQEYLDLATVIYRKATGLDDNAKIGIKEIQKAMVNLFKDLSSYSIEIIDNADSSPLFLVPDSGVKLGDIDASISTETIIEVPNVTVVDIVCLDRQYVEIETDSLSTDYSISTLENDIVFVDSTEDNRVEMVQDYRDYVFVELSPIQVKGADFEYDYNLLTTEQKELLFNLSLMT